MLQVLHKTFYMHVFHTHQNVQKMVLEVDTWTHDIKC